MSGEHSLISAAEAAVAPHEQAGGKGRQLGQLLRLKGEQLGDPSGKQPAAKLLGCVAGQPRDRVLLIGGQDLRIELDWDGRVRGV